MVNRPARSRAGARGLARGAQSPPTPPILSCLSSQPKRRIAAQTSIDFGPWLPSGGRGSPHYLPPLLRRCTITAQPLACSGTSLASSTGLAINTGSIAAVHSPANMGS